MAVTRQTKKVYTQPIGVVRASNSSAGIGQSIQRLAGQVSDQLYEQEAVKAEKAGREAAAALAQSDIARLDPETGRPSPYQPPVVFGDIAAQAYQQVIDTRFESSVKSELVAAGQRIAANSSSAADYRNKMTAYVESMYEAGVSEGGDFSAYGRVVEEMGTSYVASTYADLAARERSEAIAKAKRDSVLQYGFAISELQSLAAVGQLSEAAITGAQDALNRSYALGAITPAQFLANQDKIRAAEGIQSEGRLGVYFASSDENTRNMMVAAIQNPRLSIPAANALGMTVFDFQSMVSSAVQSSSRSSVVTALKSTASSVDAIEASQNEQTVAELSVFITPETTATDLLRLQINQTEEVKNALRDHFVSVHVSSADLGTEQLNLLTEAIGNASYDRQTVDKLVGTAAGSFLAQMTLDQRKAIVDDVLTPAREVRGRLENDLQAALLDDFSRDIPQLQSMSDVDEIRERILSSPLTPDKRSSLETKVKERVNQLASTAFEELYNAGKVNPELTMEALEEYILSGAPFKELTPLDFLKGRDRFSDYELAQAIEKYQEFAAFGQAGENISLIMDAYKNNPSTVRSLLSDYKAQQAQMRTEKTMEVMLNANFESALDGNELLPEDFKLIEDEIFGDAAVTLDLMMSNPASQLLMDNGVFTPKMAKALEGALKSPNEEVVNMAFAIFDSQSRAEVVNSDNTIIPVDIMRRVLPTEVYAQFAALSYRQRQTGQPFIALTQKLADIDFNVDEELMKDFGLKGASIRSLFGEYNVSPEIMPELIAAARWGKIDGETITQEWVDNLVTSYTEDMAKDNRVAGYSIGDSTYYSLNQAGFSDRDITNNVIDLTMKINELNEYQGLLIGGDGFTTALAWASPVLRPLADMVQASKQVADLFSTSTASAQTAAEAYLKDNGLAVLSQEIKYRPIIDEFAIGRPAYIAGIVDPNTGLFNQIEINGEPFILQHDYRSNDVTRKYRESLERSIQYNGDQKFQDLATVQYLSSLAHIDSVEKLERALSGMQVSLSTKYGIPTYGSRGGSIVERVRLSLDALDDPTNIEQVWTSVRKEMGAK